MRKLTYSQLEGLQLLNVLRRTSEEYKERLLADHASFTLEESKKVVDYLGQSIAAEKRELQAQEALLEGAACWGEMVWDEKSGEEIVNKFVVDSQEHGLLVMYLVVVEDDDFIGAISADPTEA